MLGSFVLLGRELEEGVELPFAFEEHVERRGPSLYELRPLVRAFIEEREPVLRAREDARFAVEELRREPAAAIFAQAHAGPRASEDEALFRTVLLGLLISTAEACGGFDWDDEAFEKAVLGARGVALRGAPDVTSRSPRSSASRSHKPVELAPGLSFGRSSPASSRRTGRSRAACCRGTSAASPIAWWSSSSGASSTPASPPPDAAAEIADAVSALRLTTAAAVAAGPVLFETLDGRPFGIQPVLPIAATQPPGESSRLDTFRTPIAVDVLEALGDADGDPELAEALDRWELSLFQSEPFRGEQLRAALRSLLGDTLADALLCPAWRGRARARGAVRGAHRPRRGRRGDDDRDRRRAARSRRGPPLARSRPARRTTSIASCSGSTRATRAAAAVRRGCADAPTARIRYPVATGARATVERMDESSAILERLERIEALDRGAAEAQPSSSSWVRPSLRAGCLGEAGARAVEDGGR